MGLGPGIMNGIQIGRKDRDRPLHAEEMSEREPRKYTEVTMSTLTWLEYWEHRQSPRERRMDHLLGTEQKAASRWQLRTIHHTPEGSQEPQGFGSKQTLCTKACVFWSQKGRVRFLSSRGGQPREAGPMHSPPETKYRF